jgi:hypothetical protein
MAVFFPLKVVDVSVGVAVLAAFAVAVATGLLSLKEFGP